MTLPEVTTAVATDEMDLTKYLPPLDGVEGIVGTLMRILVFVGPVVMLLLGLYYFFLSPKEANHRAGYRFRYAMSRVGVWRFTQRIAGIAYGGLGLVLGIVMLCLTWDLSAMAMPDMVWYVIRCVFWQIILALIAILVIDIMVIVFYDYRGKKRSDKRKKKKEKSAEVVKAPRRTPGKKDASRRPKPDAPAAGPKALNAPAAAQPKALNAPVQPAFRPAADLTPKPAPKSTPKPGNRPTGKPANKPGSRPAPKNAGRPASKSGKKPANRKKK